MGKNCPFDGAPKDPKGRSTHLALRTSQLTEEEESAARVAEEEAMRSAQLLKEELGMRWSSTLRLSAHSFAHNYKPGVFGELAFNRGVVGDSPPDLGGA